MIEVSELTGYKSLRALNAFHALMLGLKMLPQYQGLAYEDFYKSIDSLSDAEKKTLIKEAALFVELQKEEVESLLCFCKDKNGVPFSASNIKNLGPDQIIEMIVAVCFKISEIKIDIISEDEKKN